MAGKGPGRSGHVTYYLLVLNVLVLAVGIGAQYLVAGLKPELHEFNAGKIRFWSQPDAYKPAAATGQADQTAKAAARVCLEIAGLSQQHYQDLRALLKSAGLDGGQCAYRFDKKLAWWVFWPPEYEAARRDKAIQAIQAAGVKDVMPITQGAMAQSYSLGVFAEEVQANRYRDQLRGKGLDKVDFGPRPNLQSARLGCVSDEAARLAGFTASLPAWAATVDEQMCGPAVEPEAMTRSGASPRPR